MLYFEDLVVGTKASFGHYEVSREEVVEFASKYDPQPFHLSDDEAAKTHFGKLSASGWHTGSMAMRMLVENMKNSNHAGLGSPGMEQLRWKKPVFPGDTLRCETELISKTPSRSRPEMGSFISKLTVFNQNDEAVMTMESIGLVRTRPQ